MRSSASLCSATSWAMSFSITFSSSSAMSLAASSVGWRRPASRIQATKRPNGSSGNILISSSEDKARMVAGEHRVFGFCPPAPLREDAVVRHALAEHADLFQNSDAGGILQRHVRFDAMQFQIVETERQEA